MKWDHDDVPVQLLFHTVSVRRVFDALRPEFEDQSVQQRSTYRPEPLGLTEPLDERGADRVIGTDEASAEPCGGQDFIAVSTKGPYLGMVVRSVDAGGDIATALFCFWGGKRLVLGGCESAVANFRSGRALIEMMDASDRQARKDLTDPFLDIFGIDPIRSP